MTAPGTGRFAPSPSGPLHFGSLLAAVASYVDARANGQRWLVRIEDLDPPREMPGADALILRSLEAHGLLWDEEVLYQSSQHEHYRAALADLSDRGLCYRCACNRARLTTLQHVYDGYCREHPPRPEQACALRLRLPEESITFVDRIQGPQQQALAASGDCIIHRKDGLFAYQLAVVVDDIAQGVTSIVRGSDILSSTGQQCYLSSLLGGASVLYAHIPVMTGTDGNKLSKQNRAEPLDKHKAAENLWQALRVLGQAVPQEMLGAPPVELLDWATIHWDINKIPSTMTVALTT